MKSKPRDPFALRLETRSDKATRQVIGAYLPRELCEKIALLALYDGVSRSEFIERLITDKFSGTLPELTTIIDRLKIRANAEWDSYRRANNGKQNWDAANELINYRKMVQQSLTKRGIPKDIIRKVVERIV